MGSGGRIGVDAVAIFVEMGGGLDHDAVLQGQLFTILRVAAAGVNVGWLRWRCQMQVIADAWAVQQSQSFTHNRSGNISRVISRMLSAGVAKSSPSV